MGEAPGRSQGLAQVAAGASLVLAMAGCATPRAAPCPALYPEPPPPVLCPVHGQAPSPPTVVWIPPGCPPQFGACLSGPDSAALAAYLKAVRAYMARCADGR